MDKPVNPAESYYWRVKAVDAITGREGAWSDTQKLILPAKPSADTVRTATLRTDSIDNLGYWTEYWYSTPFTIGVKDYQTKREGLYSLQINNPGFDTGIPPRGYISNMSRGSGGSILPRVKEGEKYKFTAWVKTDGAAIKGCIGIRLHNDKGVPVGNTDGFMSNWETGTEWKELTVTSVIPKGVANVSLIVGAEGAGKAWFDDFKLTRM